MVPWVILFLAIAVLLAVGIERLIAHFGIQREEPTQPGLAILAERLERWSKSRMRQDDASRTRDRD